jgi:hypothetical protein
MNFMPLEAGVCGVTPGRCLSYSLGVHVTEFQAEIFAIFACAKECVGNAYTGELIYIYIYAQRARQLCRPLKH